MYEADITPLPFWGAVTSSKMGRDPLAVQNSSVVIYSNMVRGITNVTGRVRYNGFFCWLLTFIAERLLVENKSEVDNPKLQMLYIRRAELLLAYVMAYNFPKVLGVNGSIFAQRHIRDDGPYLDLAKGADLENKPKVYWQNSYGVFGQYYIGVLSQLRLVYLPDSSHRTYRVTKSGRRLCEIFRKSLGDSGEEMFWHAISSGEIAKDELKMFTGLALHVVSSEEELQEYSHIFCGYDSKDVMGNELHHRLNTMKMLLRYAEGKGATVDRRDFMLSFLKNNFLSGLDAGLEVSDEELSWFLYELNELTHAAYEAFHFAVLYTATEEPQPLDNVIGRLEREYKSCVSEETPCVIGETLSVSKKSSSMDTVHKPRQTDGSECADVYVLYERLNACYKEKTYGALIRVASLLLFALYKVVEKHIPMLMEYAQNENYDTGNQGFAPTLLLRHVGDGSVDCDWLFAEECIYCAINDHLRSSYSKSSVGQGVVHNYMVEDGLIWQLRLPEPIRTSPRLQNMLQYIEDMKWIERADRYYNITERGLNILNKEQPQTSL